jgi:hypothetical protein
VDAVASSDRIVEGNIQVELDRAIVDAKRDHGADMKFGCVFFVPNFKEVKFGTYRTDSNDLIKKEISRYVKSSYADAWAWSFPEQARKFSLKTERAYYPGVILGIRSVSRKFRVTRNPKI